jgi:methyltransferase, putative, TIGR00027 family
LIFIGAGGLWMKKRIDLKESRTAEMTCLARAISFYEQDRCCKSEDYVAPMILPPFFKIMFKSGMLRSICKKGLFHFGIYEYVVARTKYIDDVFKNIKNDFDQVLIFGAGFDSRAIRFYDLLKNSTVYELDSPMTQTAKINQFMKLGLRFPPNLRLIGIDFTKETLDQKLAASGFQKNQACLFLMEGLTMYLDPQSIDNIFTIIKEHAGKDSLLIFDYVFESVLRGGGNRYGAKNVAQLVDSQGENWTFGIDEDQIPLFLERYGLELADHCDPLKLSERFFEAKERNTPVKMNGAHCIVTAKMK